MRRFLLKCFIEVPAATHVRIQLAAWLLAGGNFAYKAFSPEQSQRFIVPAKNLGDDESGDEFQKVMDALLKPKGKKNGKK